LIVLDAWCLPPWPEILVVYSLSAAYPRGVKDL
jgi:hypothetical protein